VKSPFFYPLLPYVTPPITQRNTTTKQKKASHTGWLYDVREDRYNLRDAKEV